MTKRDFERLADALRVLREQFKSNSAHAQSVAHVAAVLTAAYPHFQPARFIRASMPRAWVGTTREEPWEAHARGWETDR